VRGVSTAEASDPTRRKPYFGFDKIVGLVTREKSMTRELLKL